MVKTILITGATDGIGLETAKLLAAQGHNLLLHGRSIAKLEDVQKRVAAMSGQAGIEIYLCDLSDMADVAGFATKVLENHDSLDVLINNAGVFSTPDSITRDGLDVRFAVNTIAPYLLTQKLLPLFKGAGRIVNLSSAAQAPVDLTALSGQSRLSDNAAYAQSKLALTMWSCRMGRFLKDNGPVVMAVNPASFLGSKMVKEAYGVAGKDLGIGADILCRAALSAEFRDSFGRYFDNDAGCFAQPHPHALDDRRCDGVMNMMDTIIHKKQRLQC